MFETRVHGVLHDAGENGAKTIKLVPLGGWEKNDEKTTKKTADYLQHQPHEANAGCLVREGRVCFIFYYSASWYRMVEES